MLSAAASVQAFCERRVCSSIWMPNGHLCCPGDCMPKHVLAHVTNASLGDLHILLMPFFFFSGGRVPKDILAHVTHMVDSSLHVFLMLFLFFSGGVCQEEILTHVTDMVNRMLLCWFFVGGQGREGRSGVP